VSLPDPSEYWSSNRTTRRPQWRPRREAPRVIMLHTTQALPDYVGIDNNADSTAKWILKRISPGSYHHITDRDNDVPFIDPVNLVAFGSRRTNDISWNDIALHQSMSTKAEEYRDNEGWAKNPYDPADWENNPRTQYVLRAAETTAKLAARFNIPPQIVSVNDVANGAQGIITHQKADPYRRFDPGFDDNELNIYAELVQTLMPTPTFDDAVVSTVVDPLGTSDVPGRFPFWSIYANGNVVSHNGARKVLDIDNLNLASPIRGAELSYDRTHLLLMAPGDGGSFACQVTPSSRL